MSLPKENIIKGVVIKLRLISFLRLLNLTFYYLIYWLAATFGVATVEIQYSFLTLINPLYAIFEEFS